MNILIPCLILGAIAALMGTVLAIASKIFHVEKDERLDKLTQNLPGANCGGCGFAGCTAYAEAILSGTSPFLCNACSADARLAIAEIMGVPAEEKEEVVAKILCDGTDSAAKTKFEYTGLKSCMAAGLISLGPKDCTAGCLGFGDCAKACQNNAIIIENGIAKILENMCGGCGACVNACPRDIVRLVPKSAKYIVKCNSHAKGADIIKSCTAGCIGCKICEKQCEADAIHVENNLAVIDYSKCTACGKCAEKCPKNCIVGVENEDN